MIYNKKYKKALICLILGIISFLATIYIYIKLKRTDFKNVYLLALLGSMVFILLFNSRIYKYTYIKILTIIIFIRYFIIPLLMAYTGYIQGRAYIQPTKAEVDLAIFLMSIEVVFTTFVCFLLFPKLLGKEDKKIEKGKYNFYYIMIIVFFIIFIFNTNKLAINFFKPTYRISSEDSLDIKIINNLFIVFKNIVYGVFISNIYFSRRINGEKNKIILSVIITIANISIFIGYSRIQIVINVLTSYIILRNFYGKKMFKYLVIILVFTSIILVGITYERNHVFISQGQNIYIDILDNLQMYFGGVYNVSIATRVKKLFLGKYNIFYDTFRPVIGIGQILKKYEIEHINYYFNDALRPNKGLVSQIIPMVGQSYSYFGIFGSSILSVLNIYIGYMMTKKYIETRSVEKKILFLMFIIRLSYFMGQNTMNLSGFIISNYILFLIFYIGNGLMNRLLNIKRE